MASPLGLAALEGGFDILGGVIGGAGAGNQAEKDRAANREQSQLQFLSQGRNRQLTQSMFNAQATGQGDVNQGLLALMQQLMGNVGGGILSPEEQERQVGLQTQALQPSQNKLASKLASQFGLQNPSAQLALGREVLAGEQRIRAGIAEQQAQRRFQAQQQLNQLLASLQSQIGSTQTSNFGVPTNQQALVTNADTGEVTAMSSERAGAIGGGFGVA